MSFVFAFFNLSQNLCCENCVCTVICVLCYFYCEGKWKSWQLEFRRRSAKVHNKASEFTSNVSKWIQKLYLGREEYRSPTRHYEQFKVQVTSESAAQTVNFGRSWDSNFPQKTFCCVLREAFLNLFF
jgi:ABC-type transport system involved in Fe-S cluster assembly fused permease/ATPase subunit